MSSPRILIAGQDRLAAGELAALLGARGYQPLGPVASCREALETTAEDRADLALILRALEGACDGADAAELLTEYGIPVLLLSPNGEATRLEQRTPPPSYPILHAPTEPEQLVQAIETALARKQAEAARRQGQAEGRALFAAMPAALFLLDASGSVLEANLAAQRLLGEPSGGFGGTPAKSLLAGNGAETMRHLVVTALAGETSRARAQGQRPGGGDFPVTLTMVPLSVGDTGPRLLLEMRPSKAPAARPLLPDTDLSRCPEGFFIIDDHDRLRLANPAATHIFALPTPLVASLPLNAALPAELALSLARDAARVIAWNESIKKEMAVRLGETDKTLLLSLFPMGDDEDKRMAGGFVLDITDRKLLENQLSHMAFHDPLTGLPNRSLCLDRIQQAIERSKRRDNYQYAVIFLDLDRFKIVNDSLGHHMGDRLLEGVSRRLRECVRGLDTVARLGGDEFVVLLEETGSYREIVRIIKRIRATIDASFDLCEHDIHVTCSMGIVMSPCLYDKPEELLRNANIALHRAKSEGRNRFKVFNSRMLEDAIRLMDLESALRLALKRGEFFLDYQPILALRDRRLRGFEALVRWQRPGKGVISPMEFIPVTEDTGLIVPLGRWVLTEACRTMATWQKCFPEARDLSMSVNLSAKQLAQPTMVEDVEAVLQATGLDPHALKLEITETVIMENPEVSVLRLKRLKELGVRLSVDDFGTGYSSLSYLQRFPIDTLKVDRSFVSDIETHENRKIVGAVVALAHSLGLDVVAEGVELEVQSDLLNDFCCEAGQGFFFSRPICREDAEQLLRAPGPSPQTPGTPTAALPPREKPF